MESPSHRVQRPARINPLVDRTCFVQSFGSSRKGPSKYQAGFAARPWHRHPANLKAVNRMAMNQKARNQREVNLKAKSQKAENRKAKSQKADSQLAESRKAM